MCASKAQIASNLDLSDPNFYNGNGHFTLANGDEYTGDYGAHRNGLIWREGYGVYTTHTGEIYEGQWMDDKIVDNTLVKITFANGDQFCGFTLGNKFSGDGVFVLDSKLEISCLFRDNIPVGPVILIDLDGRIWSGNAGDDGVLLLPDNHFYYLIPETLGIGELKTKYREEPSKASSEKHFVTSEEMSVKDVFAKSTKTAMDIDFTKSQWYQRFLRYETMLNVTAEKIRLGEELTEEESNWYKKAQQNKIDVRNKKILDEQLRKTKSSVETSLLDNFYSKEFKEKWPVMKVFKPTQDSISDQSEQT